MTDVLVRAERPEDFAAARALHEVAFAPSEFEAPLVDELRSAGAAVPDLCLVAVQDEQVIGHIVYSRVRLASGHEALALAPMAVTPDRQRTGVGTLLVNDSLGRARQTEYPLVIVVGHPEYYPRFGFEPAAELGLTAPWEIPPPAWMALRLPGHTPDARGMVEYAEAFEG